MAPFATKAALIKDFPQIEKAVYGAAQRSGLPQGRPGLLDRGLSLRRRQSPRRDRAAARPRQPLRARPGQHRVLSRSEAVSRFGTDNVVGRTMTVISKGQRFDYRIGGVFQDVPKNSHLRINALVRIDFPSYMAQEAQFLTCWGCQGGYVYAEAAARRRCRRDQGGHAGLGKAQHSRREYGRGALQRRRRPATGISSTSPTSISARARRRRWRPATTGARSSPSPSSPC